MRARTILLEKGSCLGGAATLRNVLTYCGLYTLGDEPRQAVKGVAEEVMRGLRRLGAVTGPQRHRGVFVVFDPEAVKLVLDSLCAEAGVQVMFNAFVCGATRADGRIVDLRWQDHGGEHTLSARAFVDASGEGDLAQFAGAATRYGNDGAVNLGTLATRFGGIPRDVTVTADQLTAAVQAAKAAGVGRSARIAACYSPADLGRRRLLSRFRGLRSARCAEPERRRTAWPAAGLGLSRRSAQPAGLRHAYLASTGPEFGTRESRHIEAVHRLAWQEVVEGRPQSDSIALGAWGVEWHDRTTLQSSFIYPPDKTAYEIPLRCLVSRDTANLFAAGRVVDADRQAGASLRVMGTAFATGQAAGVAAAMLADQGKADSERVRQILREQGALVEVNQIA